MVDPEIGLPRTSSQILNSGDNPGITPPTDRLYPQKADLEKESVKYDFEDREEVSDGGGAIVYHYLTFETELPPPSAIHPSNNQSLQSLQSPLPGPPNLKKYTSPFKWSDFHKRYITWLSCAVTALTAFSAGSYSPGIEQMTAEWHVSNVAALVGITMFTTGFGVAPMVLAPFSEINGRYPVFMVSGVLFVICQLCSAVTRSYAGMLVARFFLGVGGSTFSTMVGGVVSDIYHTEDRNTPMALFSGAALFGTGWGPLVCGFVAQNTTWRWIFYLQTITCGVMIALVCVFFRETRGSVLLSRKAKALNRWYEAREAAGYYGFDMPSDSADMEKVSQRIRWKVKSDEERSSIGKMIGISLYRPFHLLLTEPVVFWFSLWVAFSWAVLYLTLAAIPLVFRDKHHFTLSQANTVFASMCIGSILATVLSIYQEKLAKRHGETASNPEGRLYFSCVESALMPIGLFMFGWTSASSIHWIVPTIAIAFATIGIFSVYLAVFNYLADTYHRYASSALAAQSFCRNILAGVFPLVTTQMYKRLTYGGASSLLGGVGALLTLVPWILVFYGPRIRARSRFASEIME